MRSPYSTLNNSYKQQGIALIEILISVLVLGIGLLGIAALQSSSVRYSQSAQERTTDFNGNHEIQSASCPSRLLCG
jgi:Tfp pilus assembly protein PilV